jgi:hypothetical protein
LLTPIYLLFVEKHLFLKKGKKEKKEKFSASPQRLEWEGGRDRLFSPREQPAWRGAVGRTSGLSSQ